MCFCAVFVRSHLRINLWIILGIILLLIQCHDFCRVLRCVESGEVSLKRLCGRIPYVQEECGGSVVVKGSFV